MGVHKTAALKYRAEVDGLRAIAVLGVLLFHSGLGVPGGYIGVDVFFVISGYLISSLIIREIDDQRFSLPAFWERRIRRIMPASIVMVTVVLAVGYLVLLPQDLRNLGASAVAHGAMIANVFFWRDVDYFGGPAELKPLLHTWSLAIEEQFYVVFPLVLSWLNRTGRARMLTILGAVLVGSAILSIVGTYVRPAAAFYLLPPRAWELLLGCVIGVAPVMLWRSATKELVAWTGLCGIVLPAILYEKSTPFPGIAALPPCLGTAAVIVANARELTSAGRLLATGPMVFIGLISYSLYLWHWPVIAYLRYEGLEIGGTTGVVAVVLSLAFAVLSWRFVETPFRQRNRGMARRQVFVSAAIAVGLVAGVSTFFWGSQGVPSRYSGSSALLLDDTTWTGREFQASIQDLENGRLPALGLPETEARSGSFLLWGDSHGAMLADVLDRLAREYELSGYAAVSAACPPIPETWNQYSDNSREDQIRRNRAVMRFIVDKRIKTVFIAARWSFYVEGWSDADRRFKYADPNATAGAIADSKAPVESRAESMEVLKRGLSSLLTTLSEAGIRVWLVRQVPEQNGPIALQLLKNRHGFWPTHISAMTCEMDRRRQSNVDQILAHFSADGVALLDPRPWIFDESCESQIELDGRACYRDSDHLTRFGAERFLRPLMEPVFRDLALAERERRESKSTTVGSSNASPEGNNSRFGRTSN